MNALVWRLHKQSRSSKTPQTSEYSILHGRSMCTDCGHTLAWYDLLPVVSWISLKGKCRYCHKSISWQYPLVELATAFLFVFSYVFWPSALSPQPSALFAFWLIFLTGFMALTVYDLRWMVLPDRIIFPLQALAIAYVLVFFVITKGDWQVLFGAFLGVVFSAGLFYVLFQISNGKWIGGGDVKLAVVLGLLVGGAAEALLMLFIASLLGSMIGIPLLIAKKTKLQSKLPFGPLLIVAAIIVYLFGTSLITAYKRQFLVI